LFTTNDENRKMTQKSGMGFFFFFFFVVISLEKKKPITGFQLFMNYGISTLTEINHPLQNTFKGPTRTTIAMANLHHITHICEV
jgi:hypothetical protein